MLNRWIGNRPLYGHCSVRYFPSELFLLMHSAKTPSNETYQKTVIIVLSNVISIQFFSLLFRYSACSLHFHLSGDVFPTATD